MSTAQLTSSCNWLCSGDQIFPNMLEAIENATKSVCLETYTFSAGSLGERFRDALLRARQNGARVRVLVDAIGSLTLPASFWEPLQTVGGEVRVFNPLALNRLWIRNHRKLLVCDDQVAFVGGFNIAPEYEGDGITCGWCDVGVKIEGPLAAQLAATFDDMFDRAEFRHKRFLRLRSFRRPGRAAGKAGEILFTGPGRSSNDLKRALRQDLAKATDVKLMVGYFLPTWRLRRDLVSVVRRGGRVQLILAGKSDVLLSQLAARSLYRRFLKSGVEIFEYQPQILHGKLMIIDDVVYVGSSNLDQRSLHINYELMIRFERRDIADRAREVFSKNLKHSVQITRESWRASRTIWRRFKQRWAYFLLVRIDPFIARQQWRMLKD